MTEQEKLTAEARRLERLAYDMTADSTRHCGGAAEKVRGLQEAHLVAMEAQVLRTAIAALIRKNVRLEWHGHDHADINHRSTEAAAEEIVALLSAPSLSAGESGK